MMSVSEGGRVIGKQPFLEWVSLTQENFLNEQKAAVPNNTKILSSTIQDSRSHDILTFLLAEHVQLRLAK
jgi:hypothetical protein